MILVEYTSLHDRHRMSNPMTTIGIQELPLEELNYNTLLEILQEIQTGAIRKPDHFNNFHFLLFLLYDAHGYTRDRYPLWRWYHRIKKKLLTAKHLTIENDDSRRHILSALEHLIDSTPNISTAIEDPVQLEQQYLHSPIHGLFKAYTCLHTYLYMEQMDKPIINENEKIFNALQASFMKFLRYDYCDLIHFAIAHKKVSLLDKIYNGSGNWLDASMNSATERGWLPLHYATYVGDKETVKIICDTLTALAQSNQFDTLSLLIPTFQRREFENNPNKYILKACGVERDTHPAKQRKHSLPSLEPSVLLDSHNIMLRQQYLQQKFRSRMDSQTARDQPSLATNNATDDHQSIGTANNSTNDNDIPDADELELSSLPLIQREEFIEKIIHGTDTKQMLIPSPLTLACIATFGEKADYEEVVKILLDSHLVEFDGLNHECILNRVLDYMHKRDYASFQHVLVYRDTETEGPSAFIFYQFDGFIVHQDVKPVSGAMSGSSVTLNTSKNDESVASDDGHATETPISVRCFLTVLVLRDIFLQYPRWDFHLLRENIEEHFIELENALGCRPTILYPDGDVISSRKRSDVTWEVIVKYRLSSETGQSLYMQVDYYFFETFGDPLSDALANVYQTPFYLSCMTDSTMMMDTIFDSFFKRRNLHCWGTIAERHLEHCFDGVLQIKNNCSTFLALCTTLSRYYQVDGDPFMEENSATIQRIFVHAFACCVRRNAKIELDYLIKNHALIYYDSCRTKPSDIRHNILTYCVVRNLANVFDQLMTNMKTTMYKTYQNSTNPDWQPHIAWREIIHVIIDPVSQLQSGNTEQTDFSQLACYGDTNTNIASIGSIPILHATGEEYIRCIKARKNIILKAKRKLPRTLSDTNKHRPASARRMNSFDQQQMEDAISHSTTGLTSGHQNAGLSGSSLAVGGTTTGSLSKKSKNIFKNVNRLRWGRNDRHNPSASNAQQSTSKRVTSLATATTGLDELAMPTDAISLVSHITY
ncbi:unnamed protein product [Adineta ricciae]|uniref:Uncharacterized protein n=1 Tax=Adineta ricciae TaxID=249248 RepID=A0A813V352_ADIRI|nr:unnamed protein product [Adineta ricciae]